MLTSYKGKDYFCYEWSTQDKMSLYSLHFVDETFKYHEGLYQKSVEIAECTNTRFHWLFATYKGENIEVDRIDLQNNQILLYAGTSLPYSKDFIDVVLDGQEGRDLSAWCNFNTFSGFYLITKDEKTKEEYQIVLDSTIAREFLITKTLYSRKDAYESFAPFLQNNKSPL